MKKIYLATLAVFLVLGLVSVGAYSLFWPSASVSGVTFSTTSAELQVGTSGTFTFDNMFPGNTISHDFNLKNNSVSNISLNLSAKLGVGYTETSADSWTALRDVVFVRIYNNVGTPLSDWQSLTNFSSTGFSFDTSLPQSITRNYRFDVKLDSAATNTASGKGLQNVSIVFTGTQ